MFPSQRIRTALLAPVLAALVTSCAAQRSAPSDPPAIEVPVEAPPAAPPWRLGMSRAEVTGFSQFGPYDAVPVTGGLETRNAVVNG